MFATVLLIYLIATTSLGLHTSLVVAALIADVVAWAAIQNSFEAWATGTTESQEFWNKDED